MDFVEKEEKYDSLWNRQTDPDSLKNRLYNVETTVFYLAEGFHNHEKRITKLEKQ